MSDEQTKHFFQLMYAFAQMANEKYELGAKEHGTNIWDMSDEQLEIEETKEMIDLVIYRMTRILKRKSDERQS